MQSEASAPPAQHAAPSDQAAEYRRLPSIDALIQGDDFSSLAEVHGRDAMIEAARTVLADARQAISARPTPKIGLPASQNNSSCAFNPP